MVSHNLAEAVVFLGRLAADNTKEFWAREKGAYATVVKQPFLQLVGEAAHPSPVGDWRVYRPHNDTRFSADKGPLKTFIGALRVEPDGTGRYLQLDARGVLASSGMPYLAPDQLPRWRAALEDARGEAFETAVERARAAGGLLKSGYPEPLKTAPRGVDPAHPRIAWLRWKGVEVFGRLEPVDGDVGAWVRSMWDAGAPVSAWLGEHVGASGLERPKR